MHQSALHLRRCHFRICPSFYSIHIRRLSNASIAPVADSDKEAIETLEPLQASSGEVLPRSVKNAKNVVIDDLAATLEAHRASNRAAVIPRIVPSENRDGGSETKELHGGSETKELHGAKKKEPCQTWPADSVQAKQRYGKTGSRFKSYVQTADTLEYTGSSQGLKGPWKTPEKDSHYYNESIMQRPWLAYVEDTSKYNRERFVLESH